MKFGRSLRWPNLIEQILIQLVVAGVAGTVAFLWHRNTSWSDRTLIVLGAISVLLPVTIVYEKFRSETMRVISTDQEYERILTRLATHHRGTISWVTKTSIWADVPEAYSGRLAAKISAIQESRISLMRYVIHLGRWRRYVNDSMAVGNNRLLELYRAKINNLLRHVRDFSICPPERVQIVVGEVEQQGPPSRFGLYKRGRRTILVFGYDADPGMETPPRLMLEGFTDLTRYFDDLFDEQWRNYVDRALSKAEFAQSGTFPVTLRRSLIEALEAELDWISSVSGDQEIERPHSIPTEEANALLEKGATITLSCPQKICISGDYADMHNGGLTVTASVNVRPYLTMQKIDASSSSVDIADLDTEYVASEWPLVEAFKTHLDTRGDAYRIKVFPTELMNVGLGSSGAASVLFVTAMAIVEGRSSTTMELIGNAHQFETILAACPCGPQDHIAAVVGGLNLIEYPSLKYHEIAYASAWNLFTFWLNNETRNSSAVIPATMQRHTSVIWDLKHELTRNVRDALAIGDIGVIIEAIRDEAAIQNRLGMLTIRQAAAIDAAERHGGAAKVSGAGLGGVVVTFAPDRNSKSAMQSALHDEGFEELALSVDNQGISIEAAGRRLR